MFRIARSPLHSLNRAVTEAYLHGPQAGLERLAAVLPENVPTRYPGWHAVIGELHFRLGRHSAAERAWREALRLTTARADREFLRRRLAVSRPMEASPPRSNAGPVTTRNQFDASSHCLGRMNAARCSLAAHADRKPLKVV